MRTINLPQSKKIVLEIQREVSVTTNQVNIVEVIDNGTQVSANLTFNEGGGKSIVLWDASSTPTYSEIGQWQDSDVNNRIIELL